MFNGKKTFGDFLGSPERISTSVLTSRLELLKSYQIIDSVPDLKDQKVKKYYLTDKGIDLFPVMYEMFYWSMRNINTGIILRPEGFAAHAFAEYSRVFDPLSLVTSGYEVPSPAHSLAFSL